MTTAYQVSSNHSEPHAIWFDNSQLRSVPLNRSANESDDVILIDDDDGNDNQYNDEKHNGGLLMHNQYEQKFHICEICHSKLSSSYNLKRHMMIHTGTYELETFKCFILMTLKSGFKIFFFLFHFRRRKTIRMSNMSTSFP